MTDDKIKHQKASDLINSEYPNFISTQVINEFINVSFKKHLIDTDISEYLENLAVLFNVSVITLNTINQAVSISMKYKYSYYDSLIIASAIQNNCSVLFSEDLQHNQTINGSLKIINPFI
jgi:predicted nucleic acid-binding protein